MKRLATPVLLAACLGAGPLTLPVRADGPPAEPSEGEIVAQEAAAAARTERMGLHQVAGLTALGGLATTAGLGLAVSRAVLPPGWEYVHIGAATLTAGAYYTAAGLALTAPPSPLANAPVGWSSVVIHENLAWLHAAGMLSTLGLGFATFLVDRNYAGWHGVAAFSTLGLVGLSAGVIAFGD